MAPICSMHQPRQVDDAGLARRYRIVIGGEHDCNNNTTRPTPRTNTHNQKRTGARGRERHMGYYEEQTPGTVSIHHLSSDRWIGEEIQDDSVIGGKHSDHNNIRPTTTRTNTKYKNTKRIRATGRERQTTIILHIIETRPFNWYRYETRVRLACILLLAAGKTIHHVLSHHMFKGPAWVPASPCIRRHPFF